MVLSPVSILGGDSVYCINESQMNQAKQLAEEDPNSSDKIKSMIKTLEIDFSRNERAALAFTIIDNLRENRDK
tara:strand:+ start:3777 stop:3995 length:219 start_codon:yes stop_codon:yes gene_type:complete